MRKMVTLVVFVGFAFAATGCATGGGYLGTNPYPGPLGQVMAGNLALTCPGDVFIGPPINKCLRHLANIRPQFAGYPMFAGGRGGRLLSRTEKIALVGGAGAAIGALVSRDWRGAVIGGAAGSIATAIVTRGRSNSVVVTPPQGQQGVYVGPDGIPVAVGTRPRTASSFWGPGSQSGRPNCMQEEMVTLDNQSNGPLRVYRDGQPFEILIPKEQKCAPLEGDYTGQVVGTVIGSDGLTGRVTTAPSKPQSLPGLVLAWR